jgi:transposase
MTQAEGWVPDEPVGAVITDKAYDADRFVALLKARGIAVVIPPRANRHRAAGLRLSSVLGTPHDRMLLQDQALPAHLPAL